MTEINLLTAMPLIWLALAVGLAIAEMVTIQLVAIWFATGAAVSIIPALMGMNIWIQLAVFTIVSCIMLIFTRPVVKMKLQTKIVHTNADSNIGKIGIVITDINPDNMTGRVAVSGLDWSARSEQLEFIPKGEQVIIKGIEGVTLIVEHL
ncbi:MAG: NfeD family protein [Oscillospiraceae bacterium]